MCEEMGVSMRRADDEIMYLPPGFRFRPSDEELIMHYLLPKTKGMTFSFNVVADVDLYKYDPWELPDKAFFGDKEWYFFSPRERKYTNGLRPNRGAGIGYWKATGTDKMIVANGRRVGVKKSLVFYIGKAPKGTKTNWIMHEYKLDNNGSPTQEKGITQWKDWVLCRIYKKHTGLNKARQCSRGTREVDSSLFDDVFSFDHEADNSFAGFDKDRWMVPEMEVGQQKQQFPDIPLYEVSNALCIESTSYGPTYEGGSIFLQEIDGYYPQQQQQQQQPYSYCLDPMEYIYASCVPDQVKSHCTKAMGR